MHLGLHHNYFVLQKCENFFVLVGYRLISVCGFSYTVSCHNHKPTRATRIIQFESKPLKQIFLRFRINLNLNRDEMSKLLEIPSYSPVFRLKTKDFYELGLNCFCTMPSTDVHLLDHCLDSWGHQNRPIKDNHTQI